MLVTDKGITIHRVNPPPGGNKIVARQQQVQDRGLDRKRHTENGSLAYRNGSRKRFIDRGYDSDNLEVERAAFENLEDPNNVIRKSQFSHKEMEEKIQKLANSYVVFYYFFHAFGIPENK